MCEHKYVHLETVKKIGDRSSWYSEWKRIDRFYCEKCLEIKEIVKEESKREKPEWY